MKTLKDLIGEWGHFEFHSRVQPDELNDVLISFLKQALAEIMPERVSYDTTWIYELQQNIKTFFGEEK